MRDETEECEQLIRAAEVLDAEDPLSSFRQRFSIPPGPDGNDCIYLCGNSLGLQSADAARAVENELQRWAHLGVAGHVEGDTAWMPFHRLLTEDLAWLVGARPGEVVSMNSLTANLHLMMVSFYRPAGKRRKILIEKSAFPSDRFAVASQLAFHDLDPELDLVELEPGSDGLIADAAVEDFLQKHGSEVALVLWPGVQYVTGQRFDIKRITTAAHKVGAIAGFDLAHAVGNVRINLHEADADFAVWCSYKYLNAGPGAVGGCFVHERHAQDFSHPRFAGWWGHDQDSRFRMGPEFVPMPGAEGWQLSNPPILATAPLLASLKIFREAGWERLREKSNRLTGFLAHCIQQRLDDILAIVTPLNESGRGCQLSLRVRAGREAGRALFEQLEPHGIIGDWREPDIIRVAPVPLYNRFTDVAGFVEIVKKLTA